jgi:hypothetical protein
MRILVRYSGESIDEFKKVYLGIVEKFEKPEEVIRNRLRLRRYLREFILNQKRILNAAVETAQETAQKQDKLLNGLEKELIKSNSPFFDT